MDLQTPMKEIALSHPEVARTLDRLPINYCCNGGGKLALAEACHHAQLEPEAVLGQLQQALAQTEPEYYLDLGSPLDVMRYIVNTHHHYTRAEIERLDKILGRIVERHAEARPELKTIEACYLALRGDLLPHLLKEENVLFPYIESLCARQDPADPLPPACFGDIENPLRQMEHEHDHVTGLLAQMREITNHYAPPAEVCPSYKITLQCLQALESDLKRHIDLENLVLFPLARSLAASA